MMFMEGAAFLAHIGEQLLLGLGVCSWLRECCQEKTEKVPRFVKVVQQAMSKDPGHLERKYMDRWMVKALRRGLKNRPLRGEERSFWENCMYGLGHVGRGAGNMFDEMRGLSVKRIASRKPQPEAKLGDADKAPLDVLPRI